MVPGENRDSLCMCRGEKTASAMEGQLTALEKKIDDLLNNVNSTEDQDTGSKKMEQQRHSPDVEVSVVRYRGYVYSSQKHSIPPMELRTCSSLSVKCISSDVIAISSRQYHNTILDINLIIPG